MYHRQRYRGETLGDSLGDNGIRFHPAASIGRFAGRARPVRSMTDVNPNATPGERRAGMCRKYHIRNLRNAAIRHRMCLPNLMRVGAIDPRFGVLAGHLITMTALYGRHIVYMSAILVDRGSGRWCHKDPRLCFKGTLRTPHK
jgi:hypothetical protein